MSVLLMLGPWMCSLKKKKTLDNYPMCDWCTPTYRARLAAVFLFFFFADSCKRL
jgi:hypothetical protein